MKQLVECENVHCSENGVRKSVPMIRVEPTLESNLVVLPRILCTGELDEPDVLGKVRRCLREPTMIAVVE